jgi:hypothetical protein
LFHDYDADDPHVTTLAHQLSSVNATDMLAAMHTAGITGSDNQRTPKVHDGAIQLIYHVDRQPSPSVEFKQHPLRCKRALPSLPSPPSPLHPTRPSYAEDYDDDDESDRNGDNKDTVPSANGNNSGSILVLDSIRSSGYDDIKFPRIHQYSVDCGDIEYRADSLLDMIATCHHRVIIYVNTEESLQQLISSMRESERGIDDIGILSTNMTLDQCTQVIVTTLACFFPLICHLLVSMP